jgi:hypothetical protein
VQRLTAPAALAHAHLSGCDDCDAIRAALEATNG